MEYAPLQPGKKSHFLIHLTRLVDGKPVSEGPLKLELHPATGQPLVFTVAAPLRPGIFETELSVPSAGAYTLHVVAEGKGFSDRITVPGIQAGQPAQAQTAAKEEHKEPARPEKHDDHDHDHAEQQERVREKKNDGHDDHGHDDKHGHSDSALVIGDGGGSISLLKEQQWSLDILIRQPEKKKLGRTDHCQRRAYGGG